MTIFCALCLTCLLLYWHNKIPSQFSLHLPLQLSGPGTSYQWTQMALQIRMSNWSYWIWPPAPVVTFTVSSTKPKLWRQLSILSGIRNSKCKVFYFISLFLLFIIDKIILFQLWFIPILYSCMLHWEKICYIISWHLWLLAVVKAAGSCSAISYLCIVTAATGDVLVIVLMYTEKTSFVR